MRPNHVLPSPSRSQSFRKVSSATQTVAAGSCSGRMRSERVSGKTHGERVLARGQRLKQRSKEPLSTSGCHWPHGASQGLVENVAPILWFRCSRSVATSPREFDDDGRLVALSSMLGEAVAPLTIEEFLARGNGGKGCVGDKIV